MATEAARGDGPVTRRRGRGGRRRAFAIALVPFVTAGCLDDGVPDLDSAPVIAAVDRASERADDLRPGGTTTLDTCPIDGVDQLIDDALALVDDPVVTAALAGTPSTVLALDGSGSPTLTCALVGDGGEAVGIRLAPAPDDLAAFARSLERDTVGAATVEIDEDRVVRGGRLHEVCVEGDDGSPDVGSCAVYWIAGVDERPPDAALVGVVIDGPGASRVDTAAVEERWQVVLPVVVDRLDDDD